MASRARYIKTPQMWSVFLAGYLGTRTGGPVNGLGGAAITGASNGSCVVDIQALPMGSNTASTLLIWLYDPVSNLLDLIGSSALGTSSAPLAGSQYLTPANGVISLNSLLPVCQFPMSKTTTPLRKLDIAPGVQLYAATDVAPGGGWRINFYGGDF